MAIILGANGFAVSQSTGGVQVTRLVNGSSTNTVQYLQSDHFAVELDYTVTGTQYAVSVSEKLPAGWVILASNEPYNLVDSTNNVYAWNISSPLTGVSNGKIQYFVEIPGDAAANNQIEGGSAWFSSISAVKNMVPTGTATTTASNIVIGSSEGNGPAIWIANPTEEIGDGDGHMEPGEWASYKFAIVEKQEDIASNQVLVNGNPYSNVTYLPSTSNMSFGYIHVLVSSPSVNVTIDATDASGNSNEFSNIIYVPNYDYTAWMSGEWNGFTVQSAAYEPQIGVDGGWIYLHGGNPIKVPAVNIYYNGPKNINREVTGSLSNIPFYSLLGIGGISGEATATLNATPHGVSSPYITYPIYTEGASDVSATFNGTSDMHNKKFHVMLLDLSHATGQLDLTNVSSIMNSLKDMTPEDIENCEIGSVDKLADIGSCEFNVDGSDITALNGMSQGTYALVVMDYNVPDTPCLVSAAPIIVTKYTLQTTKVGPMAMPGDGVTLNENLVGGQNSQYIYAVVMVPENNYSANLTIRGDGTVNGTWFTYDGLSLSGVVTMASDGTKSGSKLTVASKAGTFEINESVLKNTSELRDILMDEVNASNMSVAISNTTSISPDITLFTRPTMPTGNYTVLSVVMDRNTGKVAAVNQTTIMLGATFTYNLVEDWNLIDVPLNATDDSILGFFPKNVRDDIVDLWGWNATTQTWTYWSSDPASPYWNFNMTKKMEAGQAYWLNMNKSHTFTIQGSIPASAPNGLVPLHSDWNMVGVTGSNPSTPQAMYPNGLDVWKWMPLQKNWEYWSYDQASPYWNFAHMSVIQPGEGVYVNV